MAFTCWGSCSGQFGQGANGAAVGLCSDGTQVGFYTTGLSSCGACRARRDSFCEKSASYGKPNLTSGISRMRSDTGGRFRGQAGRETPEGYNLMMSTSFYQAGVQAAQAAFEAGGVNALLSFLAGFNSGQS